MSNNYRKKKNKAGKEHMTWQNKRIEFKPVCP